MTKEKVVNDLLELAGPNAKKKDLQNLSKEILEDALEKLLEKKDPNDVSHIKKILDRIFELCPNCNFIPLACEYYAYSDVTVTKDFDEICEICENYMDNEEYKIPYEDDEMKLGDIKEMYSLWKEAIDKCYIQEGEEKGAADYSENYYYSLYGYYKERDKVEFIDLN